MIKVNTFKKRSDELYANRPKNQGGLLGGAEFAAKSLAAGVGSIGEGVVDIFGAAGNLIVGDVEGAKDMFRNNVVGDWYAAEREEYNPDGVMSFIGDTLHGIGQSAVLFIPYAGAPLFYAGIVSQGVSSAAAKTGEVGLKELAYGGTMGALEGVIDKALGGTASTISNAVKGIGKNAGKSTGKALFKATTDASRKGLMRKILSSGASEFAEEFVSEYADTLVQRAYRIDPTKQYSLKDAIYSGFVGMASGMVTTSAVEIPRSINYAKKGRSIIDRGNSQTLVNTATVVADKLANKGTNFKNAAGWVTALRGQVDAYNDLVKKGKGDSASAATILGEMQAYLSYAETKAVHAGLMEKIEKASDEDKAALAEYINMLVDKENRKKDYTAEDITNNTDEIASQLAIMQFAGMALDYESITKDDMREQEISEAIANERNTSTEETPAATVEDAAFDQAMAMTNEAPANHGAEASPEPEAKSDLKKGVPVSGATVFMENVEPTTRGKIEYLENIYEDGSQNLPNLGVPTANPNTYPSVEELDLMGREVRYRLTPDGREVLPDSGVPEYSAFAYPSMSSQVVGEITDADKTAARARTEAAAKFEKENAEQDYESTRSTAQEIKKEADKKQSEATKEKSSDRANKSTESKKEPPKVSEAKESLTDEQRAERARKRAKEMLEWELNNTPTVNELNTAREYVKGFDNLSPEKRQSIIRMMRTAKGIDVKIVKGIANLMAIKAGADLDLRFDEEVSEYGVSVKSGGRTLIIISSKTDFKKTVKGTVAHELVHYLENKSGYKAFAAHVLKRVKPEKKKEVEDQVTKQYNERYEQIYREEYTKQGLKGAELNKAVKDALESAQHKAIIDSEVVAELVGQALNSDKFLSRYARIGNTDGFIKKAYTFLRAMVKELKSKDKENNDLADIIMPTIKSMDRLLQMDNTNENVEWKVQYFASNKKNAENDSIKTQLRDHLDEVNAMDPVANIDFDPNSVTDNIIAKSVAWDEYQKIGKQVDRQNFGIILIGKDELGGAMAYVHTPAERAALLAVPKVLKRGKIISGHENHKENGFPSITIAGPVTINGVRGNVAVVVQQQGKNKYHAHRILMPDGSVFVIKNKDAEPSTASMSSDETRQRLPNGSASKHSIHPPEQNVNTSAQKNAEYLKESQTNAKEAVFGKSGEAEKIPASRVIQSTVKYSLAKAGELAENTTKYNDKHGATEPSALKRGIDTMKRMASLMQLYLDKPGVLPPDVIGKTAWKNGSYGRMMENTTLCIRTLTYEYFKDEVAKAIGRPLTVSESLLASQKIYDIATYPQCIYCYVAADRKSYDAFIGEYVADMDKYIKLLKKGGDSNALYEEYLHGRKSTKVQEKRWAEWKRIAKSGESYIKASDINTRSKRNELVNKGGKTAAQVKDAMRYAQSASWAKSVSDYVAYNGDILKFSDKMIDMLNSEYGLRMYSFSDYTPAFIVENMQMVLDAAARGLKVLSYTKDADYVRIFGKSGMAINMSCFAKYDSKSGTYVEDSRQGMKWDEVKELRAKYKNAGAVMVVTNDKMLEWALKQDWIDVVIPYHIVKTGTTIAGAYEWRNYTRESADYSDGKTANIYPVEHNNDFKTFRKLAEQRGITPRFKEWYDKAVSGEISGDLYMKLVNEVRLPANKLSPVQPNFDLQAAMDSFGVDADGNAIKGGYADLGGYMGNWFKKGVDVEQEVKTVAEDIQSGKTVSDVTYGRQSVREVPKIQKQYSLAPKTKNINEKIAREAAENAKVENAQVFAKKDVEIAVRSIEGWTQEEILSLTTGQENLELQHMNKAKREEMISQIYIALHEEGAKGRVGPGHVAVKALAANIASDYIDSAKIVGENNKSVHLKEIYDESSINQFKQDLTDLLYGEFAHMGHATRNADFQAIIRKQKEEFGQEQLSATRAGKESRNLAYQGKKLRELVEKQKRDATAEDIVKVTKAMADVIDAKGNIRVNAVDKAMSEASRFFEGEKAKMESEKNALKTADGKATYTLSDFAWMANDDIKFMIDEYLRLREGREGKALTAEEMRLASEVLHAMKVTIERYNKEYVNGHWIDAEEAAKDSIADLTAAWREKEYKNKVTEWLGNKVVKGVQERYFYKILTPETIVETLEGFAKNGLLKSLYHSIRVHRQKAEHLAVQLKKPLAEFMDNKENDWTDDNGHKRRFRSKLNKKMISVNGANGVVDLTLGEAIYLFMLTKREAAHAGLLENGYIVYNDKNQERAKLRLTDIENTRNNIYNAFDKTDLEFLEMAENFFNKTSSKIKYDADMNIFGYTNIQDGYYVPMIRDRYSRMHGVTDARQSIGSIITVYNKSFNQNLVENANALEGKNIMSIISDHADGLADYSELYLPLKAFDRIYNRAIVTDDGITSIRRVLNNDVWSGTERYFKDLFADIQGQREQRDNVVDNLVGSIRSAWVNSVLGANVKVVVTQTTSLAAATQVINAKYIAQTAYLASPGKLPGLQELRERAYKYSDIIEARNFDMGAIKAQGNIDKVTWLGEKSGWAIGWMDERICLAIFHAAELQIQAQYGHAVGTEENAKLAAKLADEAIYTTQAMSSASERSALQRSTSEIAKMFSMFTSDTVKNLSHLYGNIMKWNAFRLRANAGDSTYAAEMKECGREIRKSMRTLAITGVMLGLITQAFKYLFGKAEEDPEEQKKDLVADVAGSTLNVLPIVSEFVDKIFFDYDMSINVLDVANDTLEAVRGGMKIAGKSIKGEYVSTNDAIKTSTGIIMSGLSFTGLPVSPAERLVTGLLRFASPEAAYGYNSIFNSPSYTSDLKKAVESGDADLAEYILERLYKDEMAGTYTVPELEEIVRLYTLTDEEGNHYNVLPKRTLKKMDDDTDLNAAQRKQFNSIYSQASAKVNELIRSEEYKMLDDKAKAKAIRDTYELYYSRAAAEVVGKEWSANQAYSKLTDNYTVLMASKAYKSGLEAYKTDSGKEVTVKEQFSQYVKNLNLSDNDYLIVAYANGYKGKKTTRALLKYINSLDLNEAEKQQIAKALNFDLKNGQFTEKED